ncbi:MAG: methionyl-tRNA formyltransferase [Spirochaetales bacterium]|nr:methionyl-tRNA formyltransferase [Spirochaetales bacterium]
MKNRILFAGTPEISVPLLKALCSRFQVVGVLTACDRSMGRSKALVPSPVKAAAIEMGLPVLQFETLRTEARSAVRETGADTLVTFAYGKIFGPRFLDLFPAGRFNVHPSALPMFRGPAPIQFSILNGLGEATISLQNLGLGMDEGELWGKTVLALDGTETTDSLTPRIAQEAASFVPPLLEKAFAGSIEPISQSGEASYCTMISRETGVLDFNKTVRENHCLVRACYSWPKAWAKADGNDIAITGVWGGFDYISSPDSADGAKSGTVVGMRKDRGIGIACADGILWVNSLQLPAKKELDFRSFANGNQWILKATFE